LQSYGIAKLRTMFYVMKNIILAVCALTLWLAGCTQTKDEVKSTGEKIGEAVGEAAEKTADFATDATMSATVTPSIKAAIIADPDLNDPKNEIDVSSKDRKVYLTGHVATPAMTARAEEIASGWLEKSSAPSDVEIVNELEVMQD